MLQRIRNFILTDQVKNRSLFYTVLCVLLLAVSFAGLNGTLQDVDESYFAYVARDSFEQNSWLVQIELGEPTFFKSPMVFWAQMLSFKLFSVSDFAAKLPSALSNIVAAFALFFIGLRVFKSPGVSLLGTLIYQCSIQVHISSHQICTDIYYQMFLLLGLLFVIKAIQQNPFWILVAAVCNGLVFLSKSALGLVLPATLFIFALLEKRWKFLIQVALFFVISLIVSIPFFLAAYVKIPEIFVEAFITNYLLKVVGGEGGFDPIFTLVNLAFYAAIVTVMLLPFSTGLIHLFFRRKEHLSTKDIVWNTDSKLLSLFFLTCYAGYTFIGQRFPHYTLPMIPALAMFIACSYTNTGEPRKIYLGHIILTACTVVILAGAAVLEWEAYPAWQDVIVGLITIYTVFIILNAILYVKSVPAKPGVFLLVVVFFIIFTVDAAITVPMDFNRDFRSFSRLYQEEAPLYMVRTRKINETGKTKPLYWYMRSIPEEYTDFESFKESKPHLEEGSFIIFYKYDLADMRELYPTLRVLETGKIWSMAYYE